jgi:3-hydroxyacyl-CoA dehydrogenase
MSATIRTVAVVGTGVIGASWVAHFLAYGREVIATDPAPGAEERLRSAVDAHWRWLRDMGVVSAEQRNAFRFDADLERTVAAAEFVQENGPERLDIKQALFARLDAATAPHVILASSSSGLPISDLQAACKYPQRAIIGHPVNPPHVLPLVEVVGGEAATAEVIERAMAFYSAVGKQPVHLRAEMKGHLVNRLQAALWREMIHLVATGAASAADVDTAMRYAIGPRWAACGPFVNLHLSGGAGGLRRVLEALGPAMESWWDDLGEVRLTPAVIDAAVASTEQLLEREDRQTLAARRDAAVMRILAAASDRTPQM